MASAGASVTDDGQASVATQLEVEIKALRREIATLDREFKRTENMELYWRINEKPSRLDELRQKETHRERAEKEKERTKRRKLEDQVKAGNLDGNFGKISLNDPPMQPDERLKLALEAMNLAIGQIQLPQTASRIKLATTRVTSGGGTKRYKNVTVVPAEYRVQGGKGISLLLNDLKDNTHFSTPLDPEGACVLFGP